MTDNLPATYEAEHVAEDRHYPAIRDERLDGWIAVVEPVAKLAVDVAQTEFVPKGLRNKPAAVTAAILFGRELDMAPMQSLQQVYVVDGRPTLAAEHLRAMVLAAGHEIVFGETSGSRCSVKGRRKGSTEWTTVEWTLAMAAAAKLTGKDNWQNYPRAMLIARATADLCRMIFPDVTHGVRATEEVDDGGDSAEVPAAPEAGKTTVGRARKAAAPKPAAPAAAAAKVAAAPVGTSTSPLPPPVASSEARPGTAAAATPPPGGEAAPPAEPQAMDPQELAERYAEENLSGAEAVAYLGKAAEDEAVAESPRPMHTAQTKALQARFRGLGFTDEPEDRELRLLIASAIVGRDVTSFRATGDEPMNYDEAQSIMTALKGCLTREDVIAVMAEIAKGGTER